MRVQAFEKVIRSGPALLRTLRVPVQKEPPVCYGCGSRQIYRLASADIGVGTVTTRSACSAAHGWARPRVSLNTWVWLIQLFELEALGIFTIIQRGLLA